MASDQHICKAVDKLVQVTRRKLMAERISPGFELDGSEGSIDRVAKSQNVDSAAQ